MRRLISCVRPPILPRTDSRSPRVLVARGSIEYSAVTQPSPLPLRQRGTPSVTEAVQKTLVSPKETRTEPSACLLQPRSRVTGRSCSGVRPSVRDMMTSLAAHTEGAPASAGGEHDRKERPPDQDRCFRGAFGVTAYAVSDRRGSGSPATRADLALRSRTTPRAPPVPPGPRTPRGRPRG